MLRRLYSFSFRSVIALCGVVLTLAGGAAGAVAGERQCAALFQADVPPVRVAMAQMNSRTGDFEGNLKRLLRFTRKAAQEKARVLVFPEMAFSAYPVRDLIERSDFLDRSERALERYITALRNIPDAPETIFVGAITRNPRASGREAQNSVVIIHKGKVVYTQAKRLLPDYDIYDDVRHFEPGRSKPPWRGPEGKVGCAVCEDSWASAPVNGRTIYHADPADKMLGVDFAVNVSASPFYTGKWEHRANVLGDFARRIQAPVIYVNQVGAHDEIIFDGSSTVYDSEGRVLYSFRPFAEGLATFDFSIDTSTKGARQTEVRDVSEWLLGAGSSRWRRPSAQIEAMSDVRAVHDALILGIRDYFRKTGFQKAVLGLSGGIDSAVTATLLTEALGAENILGVLMPGPYSSEGSVTDAQQLAANLGIRTVIAPIVDATKTTLENLKESTAQLAKDWAIPANEASEDNVQARLRMINVMYFANKFGMLAISTSNKSEMLVGQMTLSADMTGALAPIGDVFKTDVYPLGRYLNALYSKKPPIPESSLTKPPSAELGPDQTDEKKFGPFSVLDPVLRFYTERGFSAKQIIARGFDAAYVYKTLAIVEKTEYKRRVAPVTLKVSLKSIGPGRRIPVSKVEFQK